MRVLFIIPRDPPPSLQGRGTFSSVFVDFVATCLQKDPGARPTTQELAQHPFITGVCGGGLGGWGGGSAWSQCRC